jgi:hypothetical protein
MQFGRMLGASFLCLFLAVLYVRTADSQSPAKTPPAQSPLPDRSSDEAAAKHAKRTACLKAAKAKKLVGAHRNEYVKNCLVTQPGAQTVS